MASPAQAAGEVFDCRRDATPDDCGVDSGTAGLRYVAPADVMQFTNDGLTQARVTVTGPNTSYSACLGTGQSTLLNPWVVGFLQSGESYDLDWFGNCTTATPEKSLSLCQDPSRALPSC